MDNQHYTEMDGESVSPDSDLNHMLPQGQKKDKVCLVCGDKALGYNFNAVSCESCKAFFRRNANKTIRGRCEGKCDVNVESRSFCKKCRLAKCFTVGMRKDMILDDDQKRMRKQKILINKLRRHGTLPPEDTYAVSDSEMKETYSNQILSSSEEALRKQFPNLSDQDIKILCEKKASPDTSKTKCDFQKKGMQYEPWQDIKESIFDRISEMKDTDKDVLMEMNKAHESSAFLSNTQTRLKSLPTNPTEVFNIADGFVRRIIKVAKQLEFFRACNKEDQIALLKGSVVEIMMLRSAVNFDVKTETWNLSTSSCIKQEGEDGQSSSESLGGLNIEELRKAAMQGADFETLRTMARGGTPFIGNHKEQPTDQMYKTGESGSPESQITANPGLDRVREAAKAAGMNIDILRKAATAGASFEQLSKMAKGENMVSPTHMLSPTYNMVSPTNNMVPPTHQGMDIDELRKAAMNGASFEQLSKMAKGSNTDSLSHAEPDKNGPVNLTQVKQEVSEDSPSAGSSSSCSISSDILKQGNLETKTMFLTYSKFIRSLMNTIFGDLIILKFLIMLSLFSPDRIGVANREQIEHIQEVYAQILQKYIHLRFPEEKNMFAKCIMKLTDLRNVNEVHTKMLLKMQIDKIEPLLVEIFDLPSA